MINAAEDLGTRQLNKNHAEFLAPLFYTQYLVPEQILGKCELRDVIYTRLQSNSDCNANS